MGKRKAKLFDTGELPAVGSLVSYLGSASPECIRAVELARLGEAANLERELLALLRQWAQVSAEAMLARLALDLRPARRLRLPSP